MLCLPASLCVYSYVATNTLKCLVLWHLSPLGLGLARQSCAWSAVAVHCSNTSWKKAGEAPETVLHASFWVSHGTWSTYIVVSETRLHVRGMGGRTGVRTKKGPGLAPWWRLPSVGVISLVPTWPTLSGQVTPDTHPCEYQLL